MRSFLKALLSAAEKAALIARACRKEKDLFKLLIEEKVGDDKNAKFTVDFKTLADVLIQETIRHDLSLQYPGLAENIKGEESNMFTNTLNETIKVKVGDTEQETSALLYKVLDRNQVAADLLSKQVHFDTSQLSDDVQADLKQVPDSNFNVDGLGIWIDPIDSTNNYITGCSQVSRAVIGDQEIVSKGLQVVTVLIGVYDRHTGEPVIGIVHQPFAEHNEETNSWRGQVYWGVNYQGERYHSSSLKSCSPKESGPTNFEDTHRIIVSSTEPPSLTDKLKDKFVLLLYRTSACSAGYKLLCVARGWAKYYITERASTYRWDSCAPHAILRSLGGGCLNYSQRGNKTEVNYDKPNDGVVAGIAQWSNAGGLLAYQSQTDLDTILTHLDG
eukprot:TCALIF_02831-PA protein Name:"Similar to Inpp1 Inositol polyphosphate 1-phosphatase (Mus musculus)" AED:0.09 eAED:0.09 QI:155/0.8/0.83/1/0.8/0.83/6/117/386